MNAKELFQALEFSHYAERFRDNVFVVALPLDVPFQDLLLDIKVLLGYHIRVVLVVPDPDSAIEDKHQQAYQRDLDTARGLLLAAADELARSEVADVYQGKDTGPESSAIVIVINLAEHKLRKVFREKPQNEADVQNAFESLLLGADLAYSRETERIEYSSKTYTPDFTMPRIDLAIEVKFCGRGGREKEIIAEINDDILAYQTKYGNILFVVYDNGFIRDIDRFANTFEEHQNVVVRVVKH